MFSKMPVIAFAAGLVATLCVTDVNAATFWKTCTYSDEACTVLDGDCTEVPMYDGSHAEDYDDDYYVELEKVLNDHADCESWAAAAVQTDAYKSYSDIEDELINGSCEGITGSKTWVSCSSDGATAAAADPLAEKKKLLNAGIAAAKTAYESAGCGDEETRGRREGATGTCKVKAGGTNNNCAGQIDLGGCTFASTAAGEADVNNECIFTADVPNPEEAVKMVEDAAAAAVGSGEAADVCVALKEGLATAESELANLEASSAAAVTASVAVAAATAAAMFL